MPILDRYGNPVNTKVLTTEIATSSISGVRHPFHDSVVVSLSPERLGQILRAADMGDAEEFLTLAEELEEKDLHYSSVLRTRKLAVSSLELCVEAASDEPKDVAIADAVTALTKKASFRGLIADQMDALGKGYSVSEITWDKSGKQWTPKCYEHRDPRWFMFDRFTGQELRLRDNIDQAFGLPLEPFKFIVHKPQIKTGLPIRGGLARFVCVALMCKSFGIKDWMVFAEVFGMPLRLGKYSTSATPEEKTALLRAVVNIGSDAAAIIPDTMQIDFESAAMSTGGDKLFQGMADWFDSQVSKGVLGQTMTTDNGSSQSQANVHNEVRHDIRDDDALKLANTLNRDLIEPFVILNWGEQENYPTITLTMPEQEDLVMLSQSLPPFINLGLRVEASVIREKFGLQEPEEGAEVLAPRAPPPSPFGGAPSDKTPGQPPDNAGPETPTEKPTPGDTLTRAKERAAIALMNRVVEGGELTRDQRQLIVMLSQQGTDTVDALANDALNDWRSVMDPVTEPILALASRATSFESLLKDLDGAKLDNSELVKMLATLTFKARAHGDASDKP